MEKFLILVCMLNMFSPVWAEEECVFNDAAYIGFINKYKAKNENTSIEADGRTLVVNRAEEKIIVKGGGCVHLGASIELKSRHAYTEQQFLQKTLQLSLEFGDWLINTRALQQSIEKGRFRKISDVYYIEVDAMTVFSTQFDKQGNITVDFYVN